MTIETARDPSQQMTTKRLVMRRWRPEDLDAFARMNSDPQVMRYLPKLLDRSESDALARKIDDRFDEDGYGLWAIEVPGTAQFIGFTGLCRVDFTAHFTPAVEVGWRLDAQHWGRGYATEAAACALGFGFSKAHLEEIVSFTAVGNAKSRAVMERLGMATNAGDGFDHPKLDAGHELQRHVLYRINREGWRRS